jgi:cell division protein FtsI (penicillin-binding protein 3)
LEEIGTPIPFRWGKCKLATASFGHGITTTPLQLARAYAILGNGGYEIQPTILKTRSNEYEQKKQIISTETSKIVNSILRKVVSNKEGTANFANIEGYELEVKPELP